MKIMSRDTSACGGYIKRSQALDEIMYTFGFACECRRNSRNSPTFFPWADISCGICFIMSETFFYSADGSGNNMFYSIPETNNMIQCDSKAQNCARKWKHGISISSVLYDLNEFCAPFVVLNWFMNVVVSFLLISVSSWILQSAFITIFARRNCVRSHKATFFCSNFFWKMSSFICLQGTFEMILNLIRKRFQYHKDLNCIFFSNNGRKFNFTSAVLNFNRTSPHNSKDQSPENIFYSMLISPFIFLCIST